MQTRESSDENLQKIYGFRNKPCYKVKKNWLTLKNYNMPKNNIFEFISF
jgi:hypothetical protein